MDNSQTELKLNNLSNKSRGLHAIETFLLALYLIFMLFCSYSQKAAWICKRNCIVATIGGLPRHITKSVSRIILLIMYQ